LLNEVLAMAAPNGAGPAQNVLDDVASSLGGEATIAFDGALLPTPDWQAAIELDNAARLQTAIESVLPAIKKEVVDGRTYYSAAETPVPLHYTYVDGYWLIGSTRALLMRSISNRAAALTLPRSAEFRAQIPQDGPSFFSGLLYYNLGSTVGPIADQLKSAGLLTPQLQSQVDTLTANRAPGLVYVYGEPDRIQVGSRSSLFQLGLQALIAGDPLAGLPFLAQGRTQ
jgi:hypothetical protein